MTAAAGVSMRVVLVADLGIGSGRAWAEGLVAAGHEVAVADFFPASVSGAADVHLPGGHDHARLLLAVPALRRILAERRPEVVVALGASDRAVLAAFAHPGVPTVVAVLGNDVRTMARRPGWRRDLGGAALVRAGLVAYDEDDAGALVHAFAPRSPRRRVVVRDGRFSIGGAEGQGLDAVPGPVVTCLLDSLGAPAPTLAGLPVAAGAAHG